MEEHLKQVYQKAASYCAYQERTHDEVRKKLDKLFVLDDDAEIIITQLIEDKYLNEHRYAQTYAGGKFRIKKWGKNRILHELKRKNLSEYSIRSAMKEIKETDYKEALQKLAQKKMESLANKESNKLILKKKLATYLIQKGYEPELVWEMVEEVLNNFNPI
jgi:regulatory protein